MKEDLEKTISLDKKWKASQQVIEAMDVSKCRACWVVGQHRSTQRYHKRVPEDEGALRTWIIELASSMVAMDTAG